MKKSTNKEVEEQKAKKVKPIKSQEVPVEKQNVTNDNGNVAKADGKQKTKASTMSKTQVKTEKATVVVPIAELPDDFAVVNQRTEKRPKKFSFIGATLSFLVIFTAVLIATVMILGLVTDNVNNSLLVSRGEVVGARQLQYGQVAEYDFKISNIKQSKRGEVIINWYVDDTLVHSAPLINCKMKYSASSVGKHTIKAQVKGHENVVKSCEIVVEKPVLTLTVNEKSRIYGEANPVFDYSISGLVDDDTAESLNLEILTSSVAQPISTVGEYAIEAKINGISDKYDVKINGAKLRVLPKQLFLNVNAEDKEYDGTNSIGVSHTLSGAIETDDVSVRIGSIYLGSKNVGKQMCIFNNVELNGASALNYQIALNETFVNVLPRKVKLTNLKANSKMYDGNDMVTFYDVGDIDGIVDGDKVAIGSITARYENSKVGRAKQILISEVNLVGDDAKNYIVDKKFNTTSDINASDLWNKIFSGREVPTMKLA